DGVAVILHAENHGQLAQSRGVHGLPELALAGGAVAERNVGYFVALERDVFKLAIIQRGLRRDFGRLGALRKIASGLGAAYGLQNLGSGGRRLGHDIQLLVAPVRWHLASAGAWIV